MMWFGSASFAHQSLFAVSFQVSQSHPVGLLCAVYLYFLPPCVCCSWVTAPLKCTQCSLLLLGFCPPRINHDCTFPFPPACFQYIFLLLQYFLLLKPCPGTSLYNVTLWHGIHCLLCNFFSPQAVPLPSSGSKYSLHTSHVSDT